MIGLMGSRGKNRFPKKKKKKTSVISGIRGVHVGFVAGGHAPVPAAVALFLLDAGVVP